MGGVVLPFPTFGMYLEPAMVGNYLISTDNVEEKLILEKNVRWYLSERYAFTTACGNSSIVLPR